MYVCPMIQATTLIVVASGLMRSERMVFEPSFGAAFAGITSSMSVVFGIARLVMLVFVAGLSSDVLLFVVSM